jgi:two-component system OmpR family response regulator
MANEMSAPTPLPTQPILIVDDDAHIREVVRFALSKAGFQTAEAANGAAALACFDQVQPALVVLDIIMPELDGTEVCRSLRKRSQVPIVFLSSRDEEVDRIVGLELGGDDYLTKPFSPRELVARVRAVLRRTQLARTPSRAASPPEARRLQHGLLVLDLDRYQAFWGEHPIVLTVTEFGILRTLMSFPGRVYTRDEITNGAYQYHNVISDRTIDSHVRRLRSKLSMVGADPIQTVHGVGYKLT